MGRLLDVPRAGCENEPRHRHRSRWTFGGVVDGPNRDSRSSNATGSRGETISQDRETSNHPEPERGAETSRGAAVSTENAWPRCDRHSEEQGRVAGVRAKLVRGTPRKLARVALGSTTPAEAETQGSNGRRDGISRRVGNGLPERETPRSRARLADRSRTPFEPTTRGSDRVERR